MNFKEILIDTLADYNKEVFMSTGGLVINYTDRGTQHKLEHEFIVEAETIEDLIEYLMDASSADTTMVVSEPESRTNLVTMETMYYVEYATMIISPSLKYTVEEV